MNNCAQRRRRVYAAGDVAEFEGLVYGIIPAAIEQARVAAANMVSDGSTTYSGTVPTTTLKIVGIDLTCLGDSTASGDEYIVLRQVDPTTGAFGKHRRLALRDGKIVSAILLGDPQNVRSLKQLIAMGRDVSAYSDRLLDESLDLKALAQGLS
jgi:nitrite reductase (NADH) large subunit